MQVVWRPTLSWVTRYSVTLRGVVSSVATASGMATPKASSNRMTNSIKSRPMSFKNVEPQIMRICVNRFSRIRTIRLLLICHVDAGVEDVGLGEFLVLGHDDRETLVFAVVFALKEAHGAVILRVFRVADATLLVSGPTRGFHAFLRIEILYFLRRLICFE